MIRSRMSDLSVRAETGSARASSRARQTPFEDDLGHLRAVGAASRSASLDQMRRHVADLCVGNGIAPVAFSPCQPRARPGTREVADGQFPDYRQLIPEPLQYIGGISGHWACLHDVGLSIADAAWGAVECEPRAWSWACEVALIGPSADVLDLAVAALCAAQALDVPAGSPAPGQPPATRLAY
jgi:hypothetical protein